MCKIIVKRLDLCCTNVYLRSVIKNKDIMYDLKWNEWVKIYGIENVRFVVGNVASMKSSRDLMKARGWDDQNAFDIMVESCEDALNEIEL